MIDTQRFINQYYPNATEQKLNDIRRFFENFQDLLQDISVCDGLSNETILCKAFYLQKNSGVSRVNYLKIKDYLCNLAAMYGCKIKLPTHEQVVLFNDTSCYFAGLDELLGLIDRVGAAVLPKYNPNADLLHVKAIVILGWYGASVQEVSEFKTACIYGHGVQMPDGTFIALPPSHYEPLFLLTTITSYRAMPHGRTQKFSGDESRLFRPTRSDCAVLPENQITQILKRFNRCVPSNINIAINFRNLRKNALFIEVFNDDEDTALYKKIMKHMNCDVRMSFGYQDEYKRWLSIYHSIE